MFPLLQFDCSVRSRCLDFQRELVSTYVQLRQLPRWLEKVLSQLHSVSDIAVGAGCQVPLLEMLVVSCAVIQLAKTFQCFFKYYVLHGFYSVI